MYVVHGKATEMVIMKKESGDHWPRLTKEKTKHPWLQVDWSKYLDQDDEEGKGDKADFGTAHVKLNAKVNVHRHGRF